MKDRRKNYNNKIKSDKVDHNNIYYIINKNNLKNRKGNYDGYKNYYAEVSSDNYEEYDDYEEYDSDEEYDERYDEDNYNEYDEENDDYYMYKETDDYPYETRMKGKNKSYVKKFFGIVFSILFVYVLVFGGYIAYTYLDDDEENDYFGKGNIIDNIGKTMSPEKEVPEKVTILLTGVDEDYSRDGTRTDTIMTACFDFKNKKLSLISIPRDTSVEVPEDRFEVMSEIKQCKDKQRLFIRR